IAKSHEPEAARRPIGEPGQVAQQRGEPGSVGRDDRYRARRRGGGQCDPWPVGVAGHSAGGWKPVASGSGGSGAPVGKPRTWATTAAMGTSTPGHQEPVSMMATSPKNEAPSQTARERIVPEAKA